MSYNPIEDRFLITNQKTGSLNISASGGLLTSMGLVGATSSTKGTDATLTINGTTVTSNSNTVTGNPMMWMVYRWRSWMILILKAALTLLLMSMTTPLQRRQLLIPL